MAESENERIKSKLQGKAIKSSDVSVYKSSEDVTNEAGVASVHKSSEEYYEHVCGPCKGTGKTAGSEGFCTNCDEYLCSLCSRSHSGSKSSKGNVLFDKECLTKISPCKTFVDEVQTVGNCDVTATVSQMNINKESDDGRKTNEGYTYVRDINVKSDTDENDCLITDMTFVSNNDLVLCDDSNECLKLFDIEKSIIKNILTLQSRPGGLTTVSYGKNGKIAVVLEKESKILIVTTVGKLTINNTIKTSGICVDVKMINKHLYVSFLNPVRFQMLNPDGEMIKMIKPNNEVLKYCTIPLHIAVSPDETIIYVSDWNTENVLSLDMDGNMIALYQKKLNRPYGIIISPSQSLYVCNKGKDTVYKMTSDLNEATALIEPGCLLVSPQALCLNTNNQQLYISSDWSYAEYSNFLKVFEC